MNKLKQRKTENGIDYVLVGDYYIPDLKFPVQSSYRKVWTIAQGISEREISGEI